MLKKIDLHIGKFRLMTGKEYQQFKDDIQHVENRYLFEYWWIADEVGDKSKVILNVSQEWLKRRDYLSKEEYYDKGCNSYLRPVLDVNTDFHLSQYIGKRVAIGDYVFSVMSQNILLCDDMICTCKYYDVESVLELLNTEIESVDWGILQDEDLNVDKPQAILVDGHYVCVKDHKLVSAQFEKNMHDCQDVQDVMRKCSHTFELISKSKYNSVLNLKSCLEGISWRDYLNEVLGLIDMRRRSLCSKFGFTSEQMTAILKDDMHGASFKLLFADVKKIKVEDLFVVNKMLAANSVDKISDILAFLSNKPFSKVMRMCELSMKKHYGMLMYDIIQMIRQLQVEDRIDVDFDTEEELEYLHDSLISLINAAKNKSEIDDWMSGIDRFNARKQLWSNWLYRNSEFTVVMPTTPVDIAEEGLKLRHCAKSYINSVINGDTNLLFIRKNGELDKPFFTVEITNDNKFRQIHGYCNRNIETEPDLKKFVEDWSKARNIANTDNIGKILAAE